MEEYSIRTTVSGRYLLRPSLLRPESVLLTGFHGYGQSAEDELGLLVSIPGSERCTLCSIEALHPFYTLKGKSGACWMTSDHRLTRIKENIRYVDAVLDKILQPSTALIFHGFSQGTGMASRAAALGMHRSSGLMLLGGDFPPELELAGQLPLVHIARGDRDPIYQKEPFMRDCRRFAESCLPHVTCSFKGGHEAAGEYLESAGGFLEKFFSNRFSETPCRSISKA
ncbi:MAG: phospholipase [Chlorobiaceae bacterium]|nr:phospholipase [Chlorobiaceae bacterium]NTV60706.1 phospholipase [Chlorobiaceae bacterium]